MGYLLSHPFSAEAEAEALESVGQGSRKLEGWWLKVRQFHGLLVKRFHCARRNSKALCSQILLPAFFVCVAMTVALSVPEIGTATWAGTGWGGGTADIQPQRFLGPLSSLPGDTCPLWISPRGSWASPVSWRPRPKPGQSRQWDEGAKAWGPLAGVWNLLRGSCSPAGDLPPLVLSPSQYHNYTQPRGNFIPYANEERQEYR